MLGSILLIPYGMVYYASFFYGPDLEYGITTEHVDVTKGQIVEFSPSFFHYFEHVTIDVSILMISLGIATAALSWFGVRQKHKWAYYAALTAFLITMIPGIFIHYPRDLVSLAHLGPIYFNTVIFVIGALIALPEIQRS